MLTVDRQETKRHLREVRVQRQRQIHTLLQQCEQLRMKHKEIFEAQWKARPVVQRTFEKKIDVSRNETPLGRETSQLLCESTASSSIFFGIPVVNDRFVTPKKSGQRCLSVSPVDEGEKQNNRVYEHWPDDDRISQLVGYRIQRKPSVIEASSSMNAAASRRKKSLKFVTAVKQVRKLSTIRKESIKPTAVLAVPASTGSLIILKPKEVRPTLPTILCPSSELYSKHVQTRQWLLQSSFLCRSLPLI